MRYFDELHGYDPKVKQMLNDRILECESQARFSLSQNAARLNQMALKLEKYERLPVDRQFMASLPLKDLMQTIALLE